MLDRFRVQTLGSADLTREEIARSVNVSRRSVQRILHEPAIEGLAPTPTSKSRGVGRPSQVEGFREAVAPVLAEEPSLPTVEVLHRLRVQGYTGLVSTWCHDRGSTHVKGHLKPATKGHFGPGHSRGAEPPTVCPQPAP